MLFDFCMLGFDLKAILFYLCRIVEILSFVGFYV